MYLLGTTFFALQYDGLVVGSHFDLTEEEGRDGEPPEEVFESSSDASFADDVNTRRSSYGYLFKLFGGAVDWKATLQRTVTKSTTEAELAAISEAGTQLIWWKRLFKQIDFDPEQDLTMYCDNKQTVRILKNEAPRIQTKLLHIDVHQNWLRQEVQNRNIHIQWVPTARMPADGLTKALPRQNHENFVQQLGLVDIYHLIGPGTAT